MRNRPSAAAIGPYRIVSSSSDAHHGVHPEGHEVRIKIYSPALRDRVPWAVSVFGSLDHPGIVPVVESGVFPDGRSWIAVERPAGHVLHDVIAKHPLRADVLAPLLRDVAEVLRFVHERGLGHGNLRPSCIALIDREYSVSVGDWGELVERKTAGFYDPPDARPGDPLNDVYVLGVIAYRGITGRFPRNLVMAIPEAPPALAKLIVEMLAPIAGRPTARQVRDAVCVMLGEDPITDKVELAIEDMEELDEDPVIEPPAPPRFLKPKWTPANGIIPIDAPATGSVLPIMVDEWE